MQTTYLSGIGLDVRGGLRAGTDGRGVCHFRRFNTLRLFRKERERELVRR